MLIKAFDKNGTEVTVPDAVFTNPRLREMFTLTDPRKVVVVKAKQKTQDEQPLQIEDNE